jgi:hypothetical protein
MRLIRYNRQRTFDMKAHLMTESITAQGTSKPEEVPDSSINLDQQEEHQTQKSMVSRVPANVIWTPRFIVLFAIMLVLGLSVESLLTQAWSAHLIQARWVLLSETLLALVCLIVTAIISRSSWIRLGAIFGSIWAIFTSINLFIPVSSLDPSTPIFSLLNAIICSALFGSFICFSIEHTFLTKWDHWFFRLALVGSICVVPLIFFITPPENRSLSGFESGVAALMLILSLLVWWARPSCWNVQPGLTLLFGLLPAIELLLSVPTIGTGSTNFYLTQVSLLCLLLALMRLLQGLKLR